MMTIKNILASASVALLLTGITSCDKRDNNINFPAGVTDNISTIADNNNLKVFAAAVKAAEMDTAFSYLGQYTVFAPSDSAFNANGINTGNIGTIPPATLRAILRNHILSGRTTSGSLLPGPNAAYRPINVEYLFTSTYIPSTGIFQGVFFNGKRLEKADIVANNGVIHVIKGILLPAANSLTDLLGANANLSLLQAAITRAGLTATLQGLNAPVTILAPTNAAFNAAGFADVAAVNAADPVVLGNILRNHVIVNGATTNSLRRLFLPDFRAITYTGLAGTVACTMSGNAPRFRGPSSTADAAIVVPDLQYRSAITAGAPNVVHVIDRVLLP
ncbi:MAG: fasciclin domain-containing protein [Ferruginibacter sp.]